MYLYGLYTVSPRGGLGPGPGPGPGPGGSSGLDPELLERTTPRTIPSMASTAIPPPMIPHFMSFFLRSAASLF